MNSILLWYWTWILMVMMTAHIEYLVIISIKNIYYEMLILLNVVHLNQSHGSKCFFIFVYFNWSACLLKTFYGCLLFKATIKERELLSLSLYIRFSPFPQLFGKGDAIWRGTQNHKDTSFIFHHHHSATNTKY